MPATLKLEDVDIRQENGRLIAVVPWADADPWKARFDARGFGSTLCLEPSERKAFLEVWSNLQPEKLRDALDSELVS